MEQNKFRSWNIEEKVMDYNPRVPYDWNLNEVFEDSDLIFEQYIGRKDKNKKDIYNGDIVRGKAYGHYYNTIVEYGSTGFIPFFESEPKGMVSFDTDKVEVIGNVHENPEIKTN